MHSVNKGCRAEKIGFGCDYAKDGGRTCIKGLQVQSNVKCIHRTPNIFQSIRYKLIINEIGNAGERPRSEATK